MCIRDRPTGVPEEGTDIGALAAGYTSITPMHLDLTARSLLEDMQGWKWEGE
jgi:5'-nucleotidase